MRPGPRCAAWPITPRACRCTISSFTPTSRISAPTRDETIRRYGNLVTAPGERYQYSNLGYGVLDYVIERTSGKKFADFMREEVFLPLGMTHTSIDVGPGLEPHQAIRYTPEGRRIPFYDFDHPGASAVYCSAHDLVRFAMFHMKEHLADQRPILSDAAIDEMQTPTANAPKAAGTASAGDVSKSHAAIAIVPHSGGMPGVSTLCTLVPVRTRGRRRAVQHRHAAGLSTLSDMIFKIVLPERRTPDESCPKLEPATRRGSRAPPSSSDLLGKWKGQLATYKRRDAAGARRSRSSTTCT